MCYWIEQETGSKADKARALWQAVHTGDYAKAQEIYTAETGKLGSQPCNATNVWWLYNADSAIRSNHSITLDASAKHIGYKDYADFCSHYGNEKRLYEAMAVLASRVYGGTWCVNWEY